MNTIQKLLKSVDSSKTKQGKLIKIGKCMKKLHRELRLIEWCDKVSYSLKMTEMREVHKLRVEVRAY